MPRTYAGGPGRGLLAGLYFLGALHWAAFLNFGRIPFGAHDWGWQWLHLSVLKEALATRAFPFHYSHSIHPQFMGLPNTILSPDAILLWLLEPGAFILLHILLLYTFGFLGTLALARQWRWTSGPFAVFFLLFNFNGGITSHVSVGHLSWGGYFLLPLFIGSVLRWIEREPTWRDGLRLSLLLFAFSLLGAFHFCNWCMMFLLALSLQRWRWMRLTSFVIVASAFLTAYRWLPTLIAWQRINWPYSESYLAVSHMLLALVKCFPPTTLVIGGMAWWEYDIYVGFFGLFAILVWGVFPQVRRSLGRSRDGLSFLSLPLLALLVLSCGPIYYLLLSSVPVLGTERTTTRMILLPVVFLIALTAIRLNEYPREKHSGESHAPWVFAAIVLIAAELAWHSWTWKVESLPEAARRCLAAPLHLVEQDDPVYERSVVWGIGASLAALIASLWVVATAASSHRSLRAGGHEG